MVSLSDRTRPGAPRLNAAIPAEGLPFQLEEERFDERGGRGGDQASLGSER